MSDPAPEVLTVKEAAELLRVSETTVRDRAKAGKLPCLDLGTAKRAQLRFLEDEVLRAMRGAS